MAVNPAAIPLFGNLHFLGNGAATQFGRLAIGSPPSRPSLPAMSPVTSAPSIPVMRLLPSGHSSSPPAMSPATSAPSVPAMSPVASGPSSSPPALLNSSSNSTLDAPDPSNPHKPNTTRYFDFYPLLDPGFFEPFDGNAVYQTAFNRARISDNLAAKIIIWSTINKKAKYGFVARNYFVTSNNNLRKRGKCIGLGKPFIYEGAYVRFVGDQSTHTMTGKNWTIGIANDHPTWNIIELCHNQEFVAWFARICDGRYAVFTAEICRRHPEILRSITSPSQPNAIGGANPPPGPFFGVDPAIFPPGVVARLMGAAPAEAVAVPDTPHAPTQGASYQTPDHALPHAPHAPTQGVFYQAPDTPHAPTQGAFYQSPYHALQAQTAPVRSKVMNPFPPQSAPARLPSTTGIDMRQPPPVFDPMNLCAAKPPTDAAADPRLPSIFTTFDKEQKRDVDESSDEYEPKLEMGDFPNVQKQEDDRIRASGMMRPKSPSYSYHSMSSTPFDPSQTYPTTNPFVENLAPPSSSPIPLRQASPHPLPPKAAPRPRPRQTSPMKGFQSMATAADGTEYSVRSEDFASEIGPDDTVDSHIAFISNETQKVCNEAIRVAREKDGRLAGRLILQRLRLAFEAHVKEAHQILNALPQPPFPSQR